MNRAERRRIARGAPKEHRKEIQRVLRTRVQAEWCEPCTFERHPLCRMGNCGCPCNNEQIADNRGRPVEGIRKKKSGLYEARSPGIIIPGS